MRVVGVLAPTGTVIDRLVLTGIESVWKVHEHHHDEDEAARPSGARDGAAFYAAGRQASAG